MMVWTPAALSVCRAFVSISQRLTTAASKRLSISGRRVSSVSFILPVSVFICQFICR